MITGDYGYSPVQYRPLIVWLEYFSLNLFKLAFLGNLNEKFFILIFHRIVVTFFHFLMQVVFFIYLKNWFNNDDSMIGVLLLNFSVILGNTWGITYISAKQSQSLLLGNDELNLILVILSLHLIFNQKFLYLIPILLIGPLIRETISIIIPIYLIYTIKYQFNEQIKINKIKFIFFHFFKTFLLILTFSISYVYIRIFYGPLPYWGNFIRIKENLITFSEWWVIHGIILLLILLYYCFLNWESNSFFNSTLIVFIPFYFLHFIIAMMREFRLFLPIVVLIIPVLLLSFKETTELTIVKIFSLNLPIPRINKFLFFIGSLIFWIIIFLVMIFIGFSKFTNI
jgi:hypothetical protein